ncbi:unnamed protein product, partial [Ectocarpus fasciculatus]
SNPVGSEGGGSGTPNAGDAAGSSKKRPLSALGLLVPPSGCPREAASGKRRVGEQGARVASSLSSLSSLSDDGPPQVHEPSSADVESVLFEEVPRRLRWWNAVALVPRFVGTILDLLHELHSSSDRGTSGFRSSRVSGCDPSPRRTPVVQRRKQSEHLFGLLLEIGRISHAETRLLLRAGTIPRVLHAILGSLRHEPVPRELLLRCGDEHPGGWGDCRDNNNGGGDSNDNNDDEGGFLPPSVVAAAAAAASADTPPSSWTTFTTAFAPCLRLLAELACSCAMAGNEPSRLLFPVPETPAEDLATTSSSDTHTAAAHNDNGGATASAAAARRPTRAVLSVPTHVLRACLPDTMDEDLRGKVGEELVVLPNDAEAGMLTNAAVLEVLFVGRPKPTMALGLMPLAHHAEQLRCLLRLSKHLCWNNTRTTQAVLCECARGLHEGQMPTFHMHLRVLLGLVGVVDR